MFSISISSQHVVGGGWCWCWWRASTYVAGDNSCTVGVAIFDFDSSHQPTAAASTTAPSSHLFISATFFSIVHSSPSNHIQPAAPIVSTSHLLYPRLLRLRGVRLLRRLLLFPRE